MAFGTTTVQPAAQNTATTNNNADIAAPLLGAVLLSIYAGKKSQKSLRKLKRKMAWMIVKQKAGSLFSRKALTERQIIIYVLIGVLVLALIFISPITAAILAIIALILLLTGTI